MTKQNIVLDLDSTLIFTLDDMDDLYKLIESGEDLDWLSAHTYLIEISDPNEEGFSGSYTMIGIFRPYLVEFITYAIERFDNILIWSAGRRKYVGAIVERIFPSLDYKPPIILNYDDTEIGDDGVVTKKLEKLFNMKECSANVKNTFVVDDRSDTFDHNVENGILCPPFEVDSENLLESIRNVLKTDDFLHELIKFFETCKDVEDIRTLNLSEKFKVRDRAATKLEQMTSLIRQRRISPSLCIKR